MEGSATRQFVAATAAIVAGWCIGLPAGAEDPVVAYLAAGVNQASVTTTIEKLEGYGTRYSYTSQCDEAADWLHATMSGYGLQVSFEPFTYNGKTMRNVIGRIEGTVHPQRVFVLGAHYDSTSELPWTSAPGADDNASGVAAVIEAARLLAGYDFENTIELICFGGEEQGRQGSKYNAAQAAAAGKSILGMINLDMIGYWPATSDKELDIGKNAASSSLAATAESAALTYASLPVHNWPDSGVCLDDQVSYWEKGYPGIVLMDCYEAHKNPAGSGESTPHYHKSTDRIDTLDLVQTSEAARSAVAAIALLARPAGPPILFVSRSGADVALTWIGGLAPYAVECSLSRDFTSGVVVLTPPEGTSAKSWVHSGAIDDGIDYHYRIVAP